MIHSDPSTVLQGEATLGAPPTPQLQCGQSNSWYGGPSRRARIFPTSSVLRSDEEIFVMSILRPTAGIGYHIFLNINPLDINVSADISERNMGMGGKENRARQTTVAQELSRPNKNP